MGMLQGRPLDALEKNCSSTVAGFRGDPAHLGGQIPRGKLRRISPKPSHCAGKTFFQDIASRFPRVSGSGGPAWISGIRWGAIGRYW